MVLKTESISILIAAGIIAGAIIYSSDDKYDLVTVPNSIYAYKLNRATGEIEVCAMGLLKTRDLKPICGKTLPSSSKDLNSQADISEIE
ncbi:MAG: hypothetical protein BMS9Abin33_0128 [Gammaproteobacteria bacterium]|nr:MAG: hypothetical protein BMS9Abin33_0128 [Gammaproteobacteria bacterium]